MPCLASISFTGLKSNLRRVVHTGQKEAGKASDEVPGDLEQGSPLPALLLVSKGNTLEPHPLHLDSPAIFM